MELVDRYLQAVKFFLPKKQQADIVAELSEDLHSQIEAKQAELGRTLTDSELEAILKRCGSPWEVASRFLPQRYLIGPTLFPAYRFFLGILLLGCVVPRFLIWIGFLIFDPADRGYLNMGNMLATIVFCAFFTTLVFAIVERTGIKVKLLDCWNPRKLPPVKDPNRIPRGNSLVEIGALVVFFTFFCQVLWPGPVIDLFGAKIMLAPAWRSFFWAYTVLAMCSLALSGVNLFRPYWTTSRAFWRLLLDVAGGAMFCWLLKAQLLLGISAPNLSEAKAAELTTLVTLIMAKALPWAVVILVAIFLMSSYRLFRVWSRDRRRTPIMPPVNGVTTSIATGS
jgi:hypothetical protein